MNTIQELINKDAVKKASDRYDNFLNELVKLDFHIIDQLQHIEISYLNKQGHKRETDLYHMFTNKSIYPALKIKELITKNIIEDNSKQLFNKLVSTLNQTNE